MRKFLAALIVALAAVAACGMAMAHARHDTAGMSARLTGDMAQMLDYHPTDGASRSGDIRRALSPTAVQPR